VDWDAFDRAVGRILGIAGRVGGIIGVVGLVLSLSGDSARVVPRAKAGTKTAKDKANTPYMVYEIDSVPVAPTFQQKDTWKYGITSVGDFDNNVFLRPQSQIWLCGGPLKCSWGEQGRVTGWLAARGMEADLIEAYVAGYGDGQCPPGQFVSCR
jgi:hypothetical protein